MKVAICGITGLIGKEASVYFKSLGYEVFGLGRSDLKKGVNHLQTVLSGTDVLINLAGAPILKRWTNKWKREIYNSRIDTTRMLVTAINGMAQPPGVFISSSAVGIYDAINVHDEFSANLDHGFLGTLCQDWEAEALKANPGMRKVILRLGVVLSARGGALKQMLVPFKLGLGGTIGNGQQAFPYIHISDLVKAFSWIVETPLAEGIYNMVSPQLVTNREFTKSLAKALHRWAPFTIPAFALKLIYGQAAQTLVKGQFVVPQRLLSDGFLFQFPALDAALTELSMDEKK